MIASGPIDGGIGEFASLRGRFALVRVMEHEIDVAGVSAQRDLVAVAVGEEAESEGARADTGRGDG